MPNEQKKNNDQTTDVMKALSPEETTMLSNISSIINELLSPSEPNGMVQEQAPGFINKEENNMKTTDEMEESIDKTKKAENMEEDDKEVEKEQVTTPSDSGTASDDSEKRIDEGQTETTEEGVNEVAKALIEALKNINQPKVEKEVNPMVQVISKMAEVQKSTQDQVNGVTVALEQVLKGLGIVEQMKVQKSQEKVSIQERKPIMSDEVAALMNKLMEQTGVTKSENSTVASANRPVSGVQGGNNEIVRKNLSDENILKGMLQS